MKRILLILVVAALVSTLGFGQESETVYEPKFQPQSPEVMAQGGSFTANASRFNALFTNPAAFSSNKASVTIASVNPWVYMSLDSDSIETVEQAIDTPENAVGLLGDMLKTGVGAGVQAGLGFVGSGFGLGVMVMNDTLAYGPNALGARVDTAVTAALVAGVSFPIRLGELTITPGGAVRPMYRFRSYGIGFSSFSSLLSGGDSEGSEEESPLNAIEAEVLAGMGLGIDLGVNASYGPITAAVAVRDLGGTTFDFGTMSFAEAVADFEAGILPEGDTQPLQGTEYVIPMSIHWGVEYHPDLGGFSFLIDPKVHAEYVQTVGPDVDSNPFMNLHLGTEIRVLRLLRLRAGINQGYTTMGVGVKLLFLEAHVAYFTRELGTYPGAKPNQGLSAEVALRF